MNSKGLGIATQIMVMAIIISVVLLFVGIGVLVLIHVCIVGRAFRRGFISGNMVERGNNRSNIMSHSDLEKLPCFDFKAGEKGSSPIDCVVCLESFKIGDKCRLLPICKHSFHAQCVDSWLLKTPICPICRTNADENRYSDEVQIELRENQAVVAGTLVSSNSSPLHNSPIEAIV